MRRATAMEGDMHFKFHKTGVWFGKIDSWSGNPVGWGFAINAHGVTIWRDSMRVVYVWSRSTPLAVHSADLKRQPIWTTFGYGKFN
jgi:hypothetical protein